jgi:hypothetical protein
MKIAKIKTWLEVQKTVIEPMKKVRATLLNTPNESTLRAVTKTMEDVANSITCLSVITVNRIESQNIDTKKTYSTSQDSELSALKIPETQVTEQRFQLSVKYFNYLVEAGAPLIEAIYRNS